MSSKTPLANSSDELKKNLKNISSTFSLETVDPSNTNKTSGYAIIIFGVIIPIILFFISLAIKTIDLKPFIVIYISLFLLAMALWYLIYSVRQYMAFNKRNQDVELNLKLKL